MSELSLQQKSALEQFRKTVANVSKPDESDNYLLQWLIARKFDIEKAEKMLRESMAWREKVGADHILETWQSPKVLEKYYPIGRVGYDKEGCPVWINCYGHADLRGLNASVKIEDEVLYIINLMEENRRKLAKQSQLLGRYVHQSILIIDMEGLTLRNCFYKPALRFGRRTAKIQEANYPETLKKLFVINAPKFISTLANMVKIILSEETFSKIEIFNSDRSKWGPALMKLIDADQLPKNWGGTMMDPDGNPKCPSKVCLGGDIPTFYYLSNASKLPEKDDFELKVVKKGSSFQVDFDVTKSKSHLSWSFQTEGYDIGFQIKRKCSGGALEEVVPYARVESHISIIKGQTEPLDPGKYAVIFDNSYSMMRSKSLCYSVEVILPQ